MKNSRSIQSIFSDIKKLSKDDIAKRKLSFKFESEFLNYQPYLKDFSYQHYKLFNEIAFKLNIQKSIEDLYAGRIINQTENRPALHHKYRTNPKSPDFNFKKITKPIIQRIKKGGFKNIITFGIGGSYEGPKLLQEFTKNQSSSFNYYFISGPDKDEFNSVIKPLIGQRIFIFFHLNLYLLMKPCYV